MKRITTVVFVIAEFLLFGLVIASFLYPHFVEKTEYELTGDYGELEYPLSESYEDYREGVAERLNQANADYKAIKVESSSSETSSGNLIERLSTAIKNQENKIEKYATRNSLLVRSFVDAKKKLDRSFGLDLTASQSEGQNKSDDVRDVVVTTDEGQLGWIFDDVDLSERLENLVDFCLSMQAERNLVLVENPNKFGESQGFTDYSEEKYQELHETLEAFGIDYIDTAARFESLGMSESDVFYDTDFHWKTSAGILACGFLGEYLNENCGYRIDPSLYDLSSYEVEVQKDAFLGYLGKQVTLEYTEPDDFEIWTPKYETEYTVWDSLYRETRTGTLSDTLFWDLQLEVDSLYDGNKYDYYGYGNQGLITVHNEKVKDGSRLLVVKSSYANCMIPYLAASVEYLDVVDLRAFNGSILSYVEDTDPDTVVIVYGLSAFEDESLEGLMFDFR